MINLNLLPQHIDEDIVFPEEFYKDTDIVRLEDMHVVGDIFYNLSDEIEVNMHVVGKMILKDAITLEEIAQNIDFDIDDIVDKSAKYYKNEQNTLDIVLEIPISLTKSSGINLKGEGWELNRDESEDINPDFAKLKDIFKGGE